MRFLEKVHGRVSVEGHDRHGPFAQRQGRLHRLQDALLRPGTSQQCGPRRPQCRAPCSGQPCMSGSSLHELAVDAGAEVAEAHDLFEQLGSGPFCLGPWGREARVSGLRSGRGCSRQSASSVYRTMGSPVSSENASAALAYKSRQKVVQLGHGTDRGPRVFRDGFLLDGHHRTEARNGLHVRAFQAAQNCLAYALRVSRKRRCPSAYRVSNARLDLPLPLTPVNTTSLFRGTPHPRF